jgi:Mrp family chromosome partitioning ATPase
MDDVLANTDKVIVDTPPGVALPPLSELRRKPPATGQDATIVVEAKR